MNHSPPQTLGQLARLVDGEIIGDPDTPITGFNSIDLAGPGELTFVTDARNAAKLSECRAAACIVPRQFPDLTMPQLVVADPDLSAAVLHSHLAAVPFRATGIHDSAVIGRDCAIADRVSIGPLVRIGDRVRIEARVTLHPGVIIEDDVTIGRDSILHANAVVCRGCILGRRVILYHGAVIGSEGFGFATDRRTGRHISKPQVGIVHLEDDVQVGANSCVDRAAFGVTRVRAGARIDNLVMIGHNVEVGENAILVAQSGVAGSSHLGRNVVLGAKVGIADHVHIGDGVMIAAMSGVHNDQPAGARIGGIPAVDVRNWAKSSAALNRLPDLIREFRRLKREVEELRQQLSGQPDQGAEDHGDRENDS